VLKETNNNTTLAEPTNFFRVQANQFFLSEQRTDFREYTGTDMKYCFKVQNHFSCNMLKHSESIRVYNIGPCRKHKISEISDQIQIIQKLA
jgi:hypothetical protein